MYPLGCLSSKNTHILVVSQIGFVQ